MRVVIADDEALLRRGLAQLLTDAGCEIAGTCGHARAVVDMVAQRRPDVAIVDIRMPPGEGTAGLAAAHEIRRESPLTGVLVLSHLLESRYATQLLEEAPGRVGYLLKERVSDIGALTDALQRIHEGECVIDPAIVSRLVARRRGPLGDLTDRERGVLALIAEGHSNRAIGDALHLSHKTVETHISRIFLKLGLRDAAESHRRVLAVLLYLRSV